MLTSSQLQACMPRITSSHVSAYLGPLNAALTEYAIDVPPRLAAFLAQLGHESYDLYYMLEVASGAAYEGSARLGNTQPGDGPRFKGRGPIQITGRRNYGLCGTALGLDLTGRPELLEDPANAFRSAAWFWRIGAGLNLSRAAQAYGVKPGCDLNAFADAGDFDSITIAVNGGWNGKPDRDHRYAGAKTTFGVAV